MFSAHRTWDQSSIQAFNARRDERRARNGLPPLHTLNAEQRAAQNASEKGPLKDEVWNKLTLQAAPLEKYPLHQAIAPCDGVLICPQILRSVGTIRGALPTVKIPFRQGQDLYTKAYYHYSQPPSDQERKDFENYVSSDGISPRRHEYLGPAPRLSGFYLQGNEAQILVFDTSLNLAWSANGTWSLRMEVDDTVDGVITEIDIKTF
ncbi:hypothetical protein F5878DRAFT_610990 [Lentinula raphanica]|uniref:Uncharacterized protein n=1 Tax=Lentinula raphanica TaxID=153919 RepID=A0AA38PEC2_9AGAR|nr:hypothetical protein F5878DRAFT_610990 [Lentinula raphanica]